MHLLHAPPLVSSVHASASCTSTRELVACAHNSSDELVAGWAPSGACTLAHPTHHYFCESSLYLPCPCPNSPLSYGPDAAAPPEKTDSSHGEIDEIDRFRTHLPPAWSYFTEDCVHGTVQPAGMHRFGCIWWLSYEHFLIFDAVANHPSSGSSWEGTGAMGRDAWDKGEELKGLTIAWEDGASTTSGCTGFPLVTRFDPRMLAAWRPLIADGHSDGGVTADVDSGIATEAAPLSIVRWCRRFGAKATGHIARPDATAMISCLDGVAWALADHAAPAALIRFCEQMRKTACPLLHIPRTLCVSLACVDGLGEVRAAADAAGKVLDRAAATKLGADEAMELLVATVAAVAGTSTGHSWLPLWLRYLVYRATPLQWTIACLTAFAVSVLIFRCCQALSRLWASNSCRRQCWMEGPQFDKASTIDEDVIDL